MAIYSLANRPNFRQEKTLGFSLKTSELRKNKWEIRDYWSARRMNENLFIRVIWRFKEKYQRKHHKRESVSKRSLGSILLKQIKCGDVYEIYS